MSAVQHPFQADVSQVLRLVVNSLYSNKEIFLRELVSNASDALDKRRFAAVTAPDLLSADERLAIRLIPDVAAGTLTISDNGIGMSEAELAQSLGTIAWSGSREFLEKLKAAGSAELPQLIGQFGVGFYSAYLVAERVVVVSRAAGSEQAFRWESTGEQGFTLEPGERDGVGTSVILQLKPDQREYLERPKLRALIERYSDYVAHPIELPKTDGAAEFEAANRASALWQRPAKEVTEEQYVELYKHLSHDWEAPLGHRHFRIEGTQMFAGIVFVPRKRPFGWLEPEQSHGVRLHVRRVLIMEQCAELVPRWLRFLSGVVDSEDLPLNVSRELLQDSRAVRVMKSQIVHQSLELLGEMARERADDYATFWRAFGPVLKEGLYFEPERKNELAKLMRFEHAAHDGLIGLEEYVSSMPEGQSAIYYVTGASRELAASSPHLEQLRAKGYDVLLLSDPVDPFAISALPEFAGRRLISATAAELDVAASAGAPDEAPAEADKAQPLLERFARVLEGKIALARASTRLTDSPSCLVVPEGGLPPHVERLLKLQQADMPVRPRILELNLGHPLVRAVAGLEERDPGSERVSSWMRLLYDHALLAEGSPIDDPAAFAKKLTELLTSAAQVELGGERGGVLEHRSV